LHFLLKEFSVNIVYSIIFFSLAILPCFAILTPGEELKSPGEIIQEIKKFKEKQTERQKQESPACHIVNDPKQYIEDMRTAKRLVSNALFAYLLCDLYLKDTTKNKNEVRNLISSYQAWSRDPQRFVQFKKMYPAKDGWEYDKSLRNEEERVVDDCARKGEEYKKELLQHITHLEGFVMYRKIRKEEAKTYLKMREEFQKSKK